MSVATSPVSKVVEEKGRGLLEVFEVEPSEATLKSILEDIFTQHWQEVQ